MKGLDWAAAKDARIINMSFAGPADVMLREMLLRAHARGIVLSAAVGNAGPRSPPLYLADPNVIGVMATDADDKLLPQASRGSQVAVAAPGVQVFAFARWQLSTDHRHVGGRGARERCCGATACAQGCSQAWRHTPSLGSFGTEDFRPAARCRRRRDRCLRRGQFREVIQRRRSPGSALLRAPRHIPLHRRPAAV
jgi:Subtilase family